MPRRPLPTDLTAPAPLPPRMPDELENEHAAFLAWLTSNPRPTPLEAGVAELAARNSWTPRAIAWEWQQRLQLGQRTPPELLRDLVEEQIIAARIAARKILDNEAGSRVLTPEGQASIDRVTRMAEVLKGLPAPEAAPEINWESLTQDEREVMLKAMQIRASKGTK